MIRYFKSFLFLIIFFFTIGIAYAQEASVDRTSDTILLVNGKSIICKVIENTNEYVSYETESELKIRYRAIFCDDVFSIKYANDSLVVIYGRDTLAADDYTVKEMDAYIKGEQEAINNYHSPMATIGGLAFGAVGAYFIPFYGVGIISPALYTAGISLTSAKPNLSNIHTVAQEYYPYFVDGYSAIANKKKIGNALKGSLVGMGLLLVVNVALQSK